MPALTKDARDTIKWCGATISGYTRHYFNDAGWQGDACGCPDDRCIGYHHDAGDECQCLPACIDDMLAKERAARIIKDVAALRRSRATHLFPAGLHDIPRDDLERLRDVFVSAIAEYDARWPRARCVV